MIEAALPKGIHIGKQFVGFDQMHAQFATTPYGKNLQNNVRFAPFKPDEMLNDQWKRTLGIDVDNFMHLHLSSGLARSFLSVCANPPEDWQRPISSEATFSSRDQEQLLFTAQVHDWAEGDVTIRDIPEPLKTMSDEEREMIILRKIMAGFFDVDESEQRIGEVIGILTDKKGKLGKAFNAIEVGGYMRTALRAWDVSQKTEGQLSRNLRKMAQQVTSRHAPKVQAYAEIYPPSFSFLQHHQRAINTIRDTS